MSDMPDREELEKRILELEKAVSEHKQTEQGLLHNQKQLKEISKIGILANSTLDLREVLAAILKGTIKTLDASVGMIFLKDPVTGRLSWGASSGLPETIIDDFQNRPDKLGEGLTGRIAQTGEPIYIPVNTSYDPRIRRPLIVKEELNSFIGVPIYAADKIVGVMNIVTHSPKILSEHDMHLCAAIGSNVGLTIRNAQLFDKHTQDKELLQKSEEKFKELANLLPQIVFEVDVQGTLIYSNQIGFETTGYSPEDINRGFNVSEIIVPDERGRLLKNITTIIAERIDSNNEYTLLRKNGTTFPGIIYSRPIIQNDVVVGLRGVVADISDRKKAEEEKLKLEGQLRQTYKMEAIGTMAGGIAHDFNNILAIILGNADMAKDDIPDGNPAKYNIDQIFEASNRAKDLVKQILTFSHQSEQQLLPVEPCSIIKESMKLFRSTTPATVCLVQNICEDYCMIMADPTQLRQLFMNLFSNAVHAMDEKGTLGVTVAVVDFETGDIAHHSDLNHGRYLKFKVSDNGMGMNKNTQERIFDPFYTTKKVGEGTGMGLSIVLGIVKSHKGFIEVDSEPGAGTIFSIYFPVVEDMHVQNMERVTEEYSRGNERILFVDDEEMLAELGTRILRRQGYQVTVKTSSNDALETFKSDPGSFDLVITDQSMPNMSGSELSAELLNVRPDIPIILCTGYSKKISAEKTREIGIKEFCTKPLDRKILTQITRKVLDENSM